MPNQRRKIGILIANLGTPNHPTVKAIRKFLTEFLSDHRVINISKFIWLPILYGIILPIRPLKTVKLYRHIWLKNGSPLLIYSEKIINKLREEFDDHIIINLGMRYGQPSINHALQSFQQQNVDEILILPLYPQYSVTTTASVFDAVANFYQRQKNIPQLKFIKDYYAEPFYIDALANSIQHYWREHSRGEKLLLSFHGTPKRLAEQGDPYYQQCQVTTKLLVKKLGLGDDEWLLSFQSRFGKARWLQPHTADTLINLAKAGIKTVDVVCPGFATDCLETLEEIAIANKALFMKHGGERLNYIPALNDSAEQINSLSQLIRAEVK